jgi:hypothetical protein
MAGDGGEGTGKPGDAGIGEGGDKNGGGQGGGGLPFPQKEREDAWNGIPNLPPGDPKVPDEFGNLTLTDDEAATGSASTGEAATGSGSDSTDGPVSADPVGLDPVIPDDDPNEWNVLAEQGPFTGVDRLGDGSATVPGMSIEERVDGDGGDDDQPPPPPPDSVAEAVQEAQNEDVSTG